MMIGLLFVLVYSTTVSSVTVSDFKTVQIRNDVCIYVSLEPIYAFVNEDYSKNLAEEACNELGLSLTKIENDEENQVLLELTRCKMSSVIGNDLVLISFNPSYPKEMTGSKRCVFQKFDGTHHERLRLFCENSYIPDGVTNKPVHFSCKKKAACDAIPGCVANPADSSTCFIKHASIGTFSQAKNWCNSMSGYLPRPTTNAESRALFQAAGGQVWLGVTRDVANGPFCMSVSECVALGTFYWDGGSLYPVLPLKITHGSAFPNMWTVDQGFNCMRMMKLDQASDPPAGCEGASYAQICVITYGGPGIGQSITTKDYVFGEMACGAIPTPPSSSLMIADTVQPHVYCAGTTNANYLCNAGGINIIMGSNPAQSTYKMKCKADRTFDQPATWPVCTDKVDCKAPFLDDSIMSYDWTSGLTPPFVVKYECKWPGKKVIPKSDLDKKIDDKVVDSIDINCQNNGTYDKKIEEYTCTKPCPFPSLPDPDYMEHDWSDNATKPEIWESVRHSCLHGYHLVSKEAFKTGKPTALLTELMSQCQVSGWLNETIGSYTCTKDCDEPFNHSSIFTFDWSSNLSTVIGTKVIYTCLDSAKMAVDLLAKDPILYPTLDVECLYNGQWNIDVTSWGCIDCLPLSNPPNGKIVCESKKFAVTSKCFLYCNPGYIPIEQTSTTCKYDIKLDEYIWDVEQSSFGCIEPIGLAIGGIDSKYKYKHIHSVGKAALQLANFSYLDEVEVVAPGFTCKDQMMPPYPFKIVGTVSAFLLGKSIVCGGGRMDYIECTETDGERICQKNIECVSTAGDAQWCTGPKLGDCFSYDPTFTKAWSKVLSLKVARAYASSVVMPDSRFWISGGFSKTGILKSMEVISLKSNGLFTIMYGPDMPLPLIGHCMAQLNSLEIIIAGGYSSTIYDYSEKVFVFDTALKEWSTKPWMKLKSGPRIDATCFQVNWMTERTIMMVGGWNNYGLNVTEIFDGHSQKWFNVFKNDTSGSKPVIQNALALKLRSSKLSELNGLPVLIGGVICQGNNWRLPNCSRTKAIYEFTALESLSDFDNAQGTWMESNVEMSKEKSSHDLLRVPKTYGRCTKSVTLITK